MGKRAVIGYAVVFDEDMDSVAVTRNFDEVTVYVRPWPVGKRPDTADARNKALRKAKTDGIAQLEQRK